MAKLISHENNKAVFTDVISYDEFKKNEKAAYQKEKSKYSVPGFRKGKVPKKIIEANFGKGVFWNEAIDMSLPEIYPKAIEELELQPVSNPDIHIEDEIEEGKDIVVTFEVETYPEIELADYSKIEVEELDDTVDEELVDARIQEEVQKNKVLKPVERPVEEGDIVNIDFEGFKDGVAFEGGKAEGHDLKIGSKSFIPGFEEGLVGKEKGQEVDLELTFPEEYQAEDLAGQEVVFKVKINEITEEILPEVDDDFVMDVSEFDTLDEYKASIRKELEEQVKKNNEIVVENRVLEEALARTPFDLPEAMIDLQLEDEMHEYEHQLSHMGLDLNTYLSITGQDLDDIREQLKERAEDKVRVQVLLDKLVEENDYEVSSEEIEAEYDDALEQYGRKDDEEFKKMMKEQVGEDQIKAILQRRKAVEDLKSNVVFVEAKEETVEDTEENEEE
ncbi:trigger factor [uncultured Helcococcus sp.]|uniref:trigger factor n=1 Tax=uncultured Helcococcus sp. TaxID=1072508 RepID=UPI00288999FC|nr:trigger factor [uncultured Helcococcus sp.]